MGRSQGSLRTKIHALVDAAGLPIALKLTDALVEGQTLLADRTYDSDALRQSLVEKAHGPISSLCRTARRCRPSAPFSIDTETFSSASSIKSNTTVPWPRDTTNARKLPRWSKARFTQNLDAV
jgi:hypothetical protein